MSNIAVLTWERWINPESCTPKREITLADLKEKQCLGNTLLIVARIIPPRWSKETCSMTLIYEGHCIVFVCQITDRAAKENIFISIHCIF